MPGRQEARGAIGPPERSRERWPPRGALERCNCPQRESPRLRRRYGTHDAWKRIRSGGLARRARRSRSRRRRSKAARRDPRLTLRDGRNSRPLAASPRATYPGAVIPSIEARSVGASWRPLGGGTITTCPVSGSFFSRCGGIRDGLGGGRGAAWYERHRRHQLGDDQRHKPRGLG